MTLKAGPCMTITKGTEMYSRSLREMMDSLRLTRDPETTSHHSRNGLLIRKLQLNTRQGGFGYWLRRGETLTLSAAERSRSNRDRHFTICNPGLEVKGTETCASIVNYTCRT